VNSENAYFSRLYLAGDRLLSGVISVLLLLSFLIAPLHDTWTEVLAIGVPAWLVCAWLVRAHGGQLVTRCAIAAALMVFSGLQIHQAHGMIEAHFSVFVLLAFILYYRDWIPILVGAAVIAVHHFGFDLLQRAGMPVWVFASQGGLGIVLLHAGYVVFETALLALMAVRLRAEIVATGGDPAELSLASAALADGNLDAQITTTGAAPDSLASSMERMRIELRKTAARERAVSAELTANMEAQRALAERERLAAEEIRAAAERARIAAEENSRIRVSLDRVGAAAMVIGLEGRVAYLNDCARAMFQRRAAALQRVLPRFTAAALEGAALEIFEGVDALGRQRLAALTGTDTSEFALGGVHLRVVASPVVDANGKRLGTVLQWIDRTDEVMAEEEVKAAVSRATAGDLTVRLQDAGKEGFFHALAAGMNSLLANLGSVLAQVQQAAGAVSRGADELSQGNSNLSQRTEQQASSLEETASSMEEMTSTVRQNADNAGQANHLAVAARDQAEKGGVVVARAVRAMSEINDASRRIADIIGVIDEIAFQTNLLALNAAVEAARAGEQGRGFAVVASEVRNLAGRSATAAKQIKALIQDTVHKVDEGSSLVTQSGATLEQIVVAVKKVTNIVAEIAAASQEQSAGIEQVNKAVMQLDELTQQNAALVEEASAASQAMAEQARLLDSMMLRYTVQAVESQRRSGTPVRGIAALPQPRHPESQAVA
jgi:methyl-accepting chemotaxis protein